MGDEAGFLRSILAQPGDGPHRSDYAAWLEGRGDPRAAIVRMKADIERLSCVEWLESHEYFDRWGVTEEWKPQVRAWRADSRERDRRRTLATAVPPDWLAFMDTLACRFEPFPMFNYGHSNVFGPDPLPFKERLGTRGRVVTLESSFRDGEALSPGLMRDLAFLTRLRFEDVAFGAAICPVHPFLCELKAGRGPATGADVLEALGPEDFRCAAGVDLGAARIPYPDKAACDPFDDEIHEDFGEQYLFGHPAGGVFEVVRVDRAGPGAGPGDEAILGEPGRPGAADSPAGEAEEGDRDEDKDEDDLDEEEEYRGVTEWTGVHGELKRYVAGGRLWYLTLHARPTQEDLAGPDGGEAAARRGHCVVLLAVGVSPDGGRLVGAIGHQVCHNLCD